MKRKRHGIIMMVCAIIMAALTACTNEEVVEEMTTETNTQTESEIAQNSINEEVETEDASAMAETDEDSGSLYGEREFEADLTHDGEMETLCLLVEEGEDNAPQVSFSVQKNGETIYEETDIPTNYALGQAYYLITVDEKNYIMSYAPLLDHDAAESSYEVFWLDNGGGQTAEKVVLDEEYLYVSCWDMEELDEEEWLSYAAKTSEYLQDCTLVVSTLEGNLSCGNPGQTETYEETLSWMVLYGEQTDNAADNLKLFIKQTEEEYSK